MIGFPYMVDPSMIAIVEVNNEATRILTRRKSTTPTSSWIKVKSRRNHLNLNLLSRAVVLEKRTKFFEVEP